MSSELLTPYDCALIVRTLKNANYQARHASTGLTREALSDVHRRENIIAKLQLKAKGAPSATK